MSKTSFIRLGKAFITSLVAVYVFVHGPSLYANAQYWLQQIKPKENAFSVSAPNAQAMIRPILLPVSNIQEKPLPNEATLAIKKINVSVPVVFGVGSDADAIYKNLSNGVVHYSVTPKPGDGGASVILCHSSLYPWQYNKYGAPCALIGKLAQGDEITVKYSDGRIFNYAMTKSIVFNPLEGDDDKRLAEFESSPKPILLLVTCWPIGTNKNRIAIQAELQ